eukprot:11495319-Alexandrium_andersonii.AAC.1
MSSRAHLRPPRLRSRPTSSRCELQKQYQCRPGATSTGESAVPDRDPPAPRTHDAHRDARGQVHAGEA